MFNFFNRLQSRFPSFSSAITRNAVTNWFYLGWYGTSPDVGKEKQKFRKQFFSDRSFIDDMALSWGEKGWMQKLCFVLVGIGLISFAMSFWGVIPTLLANTVVLLSLHFLDRQYQRLERHVQALFEHTLHFQDLIQRANTSTQALSALLESQKLETLRAQRELTEAKKKMGEFHEYVETIKGLAKLAEEGHQAFEKVVSIAEKTALHENVAELNALFPECIASLRQLHEQLQFYRAKIEKYKPSGEEYEKRKLVVAQLRAMIAKYQAKEADSPPLHGSNPGFFAAPIDTPPGAPVDDSHGVHAVPHTSIHIH